MSDFELVYLFNELLSSSSARVFDFMSGLFAMLLASYVVGPKLGRGIARLTIALFTMFAVAMIPPAVGAAARLAAVAGEVARASAEPGSQIDWVWLPPEGPYIPVFVVLLLLGGYVGAIVFFMQMRQSRQQ